MEKPSGGTAADGPRRSSVFPDAAVATRSRAGRRGVRAPAI
jgi:hypothetical protein